MIEENLGILTNITVEGFKSIKKMDLPLTPLNVIIGPNGVGKSNFIGVFKLLYNIVNQNLQSYIAQSGGAERFLHFGNKNTNEKIKVCNTLDVMPQRYRRIKYSITSGKLDANNANIAMIIKLVANIVLIRLCAMRSDEPKKYPSDINPKNIPIIILVITALEPTQKDNWRNTTNSKDKLTYPFKNIKNINQIRNLRDITNPLFSCGKC